MKRLLAMIVVGLASSAPIAAQTVLPTWSEQIAVREGWLKQRHAMLLPMMRRHNINMWVDRKSVV